MNRSPRPPRRSRLALLPLLAVLPLAAAPALAQHEHGGGFLGGNAPLQAGAQSGNVIDVPTPDVGASTMKARENAEIATLPSFKVFHDFKLTDHLPESGIAWSHHIVDDAGRTYKAAHYDHGNGIVAADVDGDGLPDVYFVNQLGKSALYKNLGNGTFKDITAAAGVGLGDRITVSASFADVDNDGDQDLFVTSVRGGNVLFENDGHGHFKDISKASGLDYVGHSSAAVFFDYDHDGKLDLFLVNVGRYTTNTMAGDAGARYYGAFNDAF